MDKINSQLFDIFDENDAQEFDLIKASGVIGQHAERLQLSIKSIKDTAIEVPVETIGGGVGITKLLMNLINSNQMVATMDGIGKDVLEKLKSGEYIIPDSKQVAGQNRPCIVDKDNAIVKWLTLKKVKNVDALLADVSNLTVQTALYNISQQLESFEQSIDYLIARERRKDLQNPYFVARKAIQESVIIEDAEIKKHKILGAIDKLGEGLDALYSDFDLNVNQLLTCYSDWKPVLKKMDEYIAYINEDINLIPKYVSLLSYVYNACGEYKAATARVNEYKTFIGNLQTKYYGKGRKMITGAELLQMTCPYNNENMDFWMRAPKELYKQLDSITFKMTEGDKPDYIVEGHEAKCDE